MASKTVFWLLTIVIGAHCSVVNRTLSSFDSVNNGQFLNVSDIAPDKYISGGHAATVGSFPWIARLSIRDRTEMASYLCAGSLISHRHVLTAAHCLQHDIKNFQDVTIYLGEYDTASFPNDCVENKCTKNIKVYPNKIVYHEGYNPKTIANDIALLRLQNRVYSTAYIRPILLPPFNIDDPINDGVGVTIAGWGGTEAGHTSNILLTTEINLVPRKKCIAIDANVPKNHLCAGDPNGRDTCPGDSGGPLMMFNKKKYYLSGIVSYGPNVKCGTSKLGYYTNVFQYLKWIKSNM